MKLWAKVISNGKIINELARDFVSAQVSLYNGGAGNTNLQEMITALCKELDLSCPVLLYKHERDFRLFKRVVFRAADFMESVSFDFLEFELIDEKKPDGKITFSTF